MPGFFRDALKTIEKISNISASESLDIFLPKINIVTLFSIIEQGEVVFIKVTSTFNKRR